MTSRTFSAALATAASVAMALLPLPPDSLDPAAAEVGKNLDGLHVVDGDTWRAENEFSVEWDPSPRESSPVHYAIRTSTGDPIPGYEVQTTGNSVVGDLHVPPVPGIYSFEAWANNARQSVPLYFDDARPAPVEIDVPDWIAAGHDIQVGLSHPAPPLPLSGLAGYAVSVDDQPGSSPCEAPGRCSGTELDLPGGIDDDSIALPAPAEGISYVHALAVSDTGMASTVVATAPVGVDGTPPTVHLEGVPTGWASGPVRITAVAVDPLSGMAPGGRTGPFTALGVDGGAVLTIPGPRAGTTVTGEGAHTVRFYARDAVGNSSDGSAPFAAPATASVRIDETAPKVRFVAADPTDPERIEATVSDALSGPDLDHGSIEVRPLGAGSRFTPLATDTHGGRLVARWSSDDFPRGAYEFRAIGFDAAGNSTASNTGPGGAPFVLRNPVKREAQLAFGFGAEQLVFQRCSRDGGGRRCHRAVVRPFAQRPVARTFPCCHTTVVGGLLRDGDGVPLAGQTVEVVETFADGAQEPVHHTAVTTDADGRFRMQLAPGPSRRVEAEFRGTRLLTRAAAASPLRLRVRAGVHLGVSSAQARVGGPPIVFSGRILHPEASLPPAGLPVELEFRLPGMAWSEFRTVQSDAAGRFRYPYSFSDDDSVGVRFLFRASVPATGKWPFAPATSRPLAVTG